ncbi:MAG TPA: nucleotidyltransferase family protein [Cellvibrio sp.]|nr:nucleotidyltransferase family protein [Cellvibrio sp.]
MTLDVLALDILALDVLVLAAGSASRFGGCKLLADWQGQPLIAASINAANALKPEKMIIVAGAFYSQLKEAQLNLNDVELIEFRDWPLGMGHSLAFGVSHMPSDNPVLILLGDQPLIRAQDLQNLYNAWCAQPTKIACSIFADSFGVPAIFPAQFKTELRACTGDRGAKNVLTRYADELIRVPMPTAEFDVDTPTDLDRLLLKKYCSLTE